MTYLIARPADAATSPPRDNYVFPPRLSPAPLRDDRQEDRTITTMAGGMIKYRHLSRDSAARKALLRGLVTSLVAHEHIMTTYAKAKEAQRMADKLITLAKKDTEPCRRSAQAMLYVRLPPLLPTLETGTKEGISGIEMW